MNKAWFCLCVSEKTPDGPGSFWGFYPTKELAAQEANIAGCTNGNHIVVYGPGPTSKAVEDGVNTSNWLFSSGNGDHWIKAVAYWSVNRNKIPEGLKEWFSSECPAGSVREKDYWRIAKDIEEKENVA